jgi:alanyl-tRNA synthetase
MKKMTSAEVREAFLDFFEEMNHKRVASSSLVPGNDPTLLFTNAGMVQFKDVFLGLDKRPYSRATTSQKCMRVSGKHNDLENVGPSPRHHTFFEMLGNFSFGDYFKRDAIRYAYDLLTKVYGMPPERLIFTVHHTDDEAYNIWREEIGAPAEQIYRMGDKTNFWQMADVGPCGPTSEVHWDWGPQMCSCGMGDEPHFELDNGCDRYLEIWNLVFMQYRQFEDGHREPLPAPGVDTGAGLERIVSVLQNTRANYETDLFMPIIRRTQALTGHSDAERDKNIIPYRVIADHMRAATFLIADGVRPGATGRDYICRMVIRRAVRFGTKLGFEQPFLADVADSVVDLMSLAYPELLEKRDAIRRTITNEEVRFRRAMDRALDELDQMLDDLSETVKEQLNAYLAPLFGKTPSRTPSTNDPLGGQMQQIDQMLAASGAGNVLEKLVGQIGQGVKLNDILNMLPSDSGTRDTLAMLGQLPGDQAFRLHAEKGLPLEITRDIAQERGFTVDEVGFRAAQKQHETTSRGQDGGAFGTIDMGQAYQIALNALRRQGLIQDGVQQDQYGALSRAARVLAILRDGQMVENASVGDRVEMVLDLTPFYIEAGGQVSDTGVIEGNGWTVDVEDARQPIGGLIVHSGEVTEGRPTLGAACMVRVDGERRLDIMRNHTATHLLHAQLRAVLGSHVQQRGSLVAPDRLRFDFSHDQPITDEELDAITRGINEAILANMPVKAVWKDLDSAKSEGAMALFGEKYGERVRTINIMEDDKTRYSYELCGGNHVEETGVIGQFVIVSEGSVAQGIRRVEALTGHGAEDYVRRSLGQLRDTAALLGTTPDALRTRIGALQDDLKAEQQENARLRRRIARFEFEDLLNTVQQHGETAVLVARVNPTTTDTLREMCDWFRDKFKSGVVVLGTVADSGKPQLIAAATADLKKRIHAGEIIKASAQIVGGGGGGRPDMAQAGGKDPEKLDEALRHAADLIHQALG